MSNPSKVEAFVTDPDEFEKYCRTQHPNKVESWWEVNNHEELARLVMKHAPHLLVFNENASDEAKEAALLILHQGVSDEAKEAVLAEATHTDVPGTSRRRTLPQLTVTTTTATVAAVHAFLDSYPVLRGLELPKKVTSK